MLALWITAGVCNNTSGEDEACRTTLQAIGMQSPFLEWKLLRADCCLFDWR
jgi:hypothetical protein